MLCPYPYYRVQESYLGEWLCTSRKRFCVKIVCWRSSVTGRPEGGAVGFAKPLEKGSRFEDYSTTRVALRGRKQRAFEVIAPRTAPVVPRLTPSDDIEVQRKAGSIHNPRWVGW